jgi:predicted SprT family Zn-dependent metalloprotease
LASKKGGEEMFEGRKAKKLGLKDLGKVENVLVSRTPFFSNVTFKAHVFCKTRARRGKRITGEGRGELVYWCPKCEVILKP